ncbi:unnamed protein product [Lasius platythorax]|uniref:Uncharacterized protein n=1 Tax=Lasius platythorax TaxID=488582 RepID=A0AAV2NRC8_9HYME
MMVAVAYQRIRDTQKTFHLLIERAGSHGKLGLGVSVSHITRDDRPNTSLRRTLENTRAPGTPGESLEESDLAENAREIAAPDCVSQLHEKSRNQDPIGTACYSERISSSAGKLCFLTQRGRGMLHRTSPT